MAKKEGTAWVLPTATGFTLAVVYTRTESWWLALPAAVAVALVIYLAQCWIWPFANCWWCKGSPRKNQNKSGRTWRNCRVCKGSGQRLRVGRRAWNRYSKIRKRARKADAA